MKRIERSRNPIRSRRSRNIAETSFSRQLNTSIRKNAYFERFSWIKKNWPPELTNYISLLATVYSGFYRWRIQALCRLQNFENSKLLRGNLLSKKLRKNTRFIFRHDFFFSSFLHLFSCRLNFYQYIFLTFRIFAFL